MRCIFSSLLLVAAMVHATGAHASFQGSEAAGKEADRNATLNRLLTDYPKTLNPIIYSSASENDIIGVQTIFEPLMDIDPDTGDAVCWLCTSYDYDLADRKIAIFKIRQDAKFHDGKPLTAHDVKFSFDAMLHPKVDNLNLKSDVMAAVAKVEVVDEYTVKITFKKLGYANIYQVGIPIVPKHLFPYFDKHPENFNKDQKFGRSPIGSGPYKFVKWDASKYVELQRNDDWWGFKDERFKHAFNFKKIRFKIITNDNVTVPAFKKGEFDFMALQSFQYDELTKAKEKLKVVPVHLEPKLNASFMFMAWNSRLPIFADVKTRHALSLLTDRKQTLDKFSKGLRPQTNGPWGVSSPYSCPLSECPIVPFDPTLAKKLLTEAGWADSNKDGCLDRKVDGKDQTLKFSILAGDGDYNKNVLGVYVTAMKKAGVCAGIRQLDWTAMIKLIDDLNFESYISGFQMAWPILPRQLFHSENVGKTGSNTWNFVDKDADKLIEQVEAEFDAAKRQDLMRQIHKLIYNAQIANWHHEGGGCYLGRSQDLLGMEVADYRASCIYWPRWYKKKK